VELVEGIAKVVEANGPGGLLDVFDGDFHPAFEWHPGIVGLSRISYSGREEFREYLNQIDATSRRVELRNWTVRAAGDQHVLLTGELGFESREKEHVAFDAEYAVLYRVEDGRLRSGRSFSSIAEAEEAAMALADA
jgi:ketosteroid isomerase-like protein